MASGEVTDSATDFCRNALLPLSLIRHYSSFFGRRELYVAAWGRDDSAPFGAGWRADWDHRLQQTVHGFIYVRPDGQEIDLRARVDGRMVHTGYGVEIERADANGVRIVDFKRGRARVTHVFALMGNQWRLHSIEYRGPNRIEVVHDAHGRVIRLEHARSRSALTLTYVDDRIALVELMTPDGGRHFAAGYRYDEQGLLVEVQDRGGRAVTYAYHTNRLLALVTKREGAVFYVEYDREGRCTRVSGMDGYHLRDFRYDAVARRTMVGNAYGEVWTHELDAVGRIIATTSPLGRRSSFEFDAMGRLERAADAAQRITTCEYDELGRLVAYRRPAESRFWVYDDYHRIIAHSDAVQDICADYDGTHSLVSIELDSGSWELTYNVHGERTSLRTPLGATQTNLYDSFGNLVGESDFNGNFVRYEYDAFGRCTRVIDPLGGIEEHVTDELDRPVASIHRSGTTSRVEHTLNGRITQGMTGMHEALRHDLYGRALEHVDGEGLIGRLQWGKEPGQIVEVHDAAGHREHYYYDADDRIVALHTLDGRHVRVEHSDLGMVSVEVRSDAPISGERPGIRTDFELDDTGRVIRVSSGGLERRFEYDEDAFLTWAETKDTLVELTYDSSGRCEREMVATRANEPLHPMVVQRGFDALGSKVRIGCTDAPDVSMGRDQNARVCSVRVGDVAVQYVCDANGAEVERASLGARLSMKRDLGGHVTSYIYEVAGVEPVRLQISYDTRGHPSFLSVASKGTESDMILRYDSRRRLRAIVRRGSDLPSEFFAYDGEGHWVFHARTGRGDELLQVLETNGWERTMVIAAYYAEESATATVLAGGRLETMRVGGVSVHYAWDERGRVYEKRVLCGDREDVWGFEYDAWDAPVRVRSPQGGIFEYRYDAFGRCIERTSSTGAAVRLVWDGQYILHVFTGGVLTETRLSSDDSGELLLRCLGDGRVDIRSDAFRELEELLAGDGSVGPPSTKPTMAQSFYDRESLTIIGLGRYVDVETGYHLTWQRGEPLAGLPAFPRARPDPIVRVVSDGMMLPVETSSSGRDAFMSSAVRSIVSR
ncbi:DUF6531 domain-containing protein [Pendulispora brunnea]|uniref:DUF6531 domain-containing protein n=1 Tax=Pendulispora brunnea TaxID=2905690 RepID=A0ABZ2KNV6_9BACT